MRLPLIGITGPARAGKDTTANLMLSMQGGYIYSMALPIKEMLRVGFGIDMADPYWAANKELVIPAFGKSPRQLMQTLGTEWGRIQVDENVWVTLAKSRLLSAGPGMIVPDIRFLNEADWVRAHGRLFHIKRKSAPGVAAHVSEAGVEYRPDLGDVIIGNNGSLEDLRHWVSETIQESHVV